MPLGRVEGTCPFQFEFPGDHTAGATPVPIPNTAVKPRRANVTARFAEWESRSSPGLKSAAAGHRARRCCFYTLLALSPAEGHELLPLCQES